MIYGYKRFIRLAIGANLRVLLVQLEVWGRKLALVYLLWLDWAKFHLWATWWRCRQSFWKKFSKNGDVFGLLFKWSNFITFSPKEVTWKISIFKVLIEAWCIKFWTVRFGVDFRIFFVWQLFWLLFPKLLIALILPIMSLKRANLLSSP